ncbi:hypothetical protein VTN02DRAFT_903 [Thermoascus thermophilus]
MFIEHDTICADAPGRLALPCLWAFQSARFRPNSCARGPQTNPEMIWRQIARRGKKIHVMKDAFDLVDISADLFTSIGEKKKGEPGSASKPRISLPRSPAQREKKKKRT